MALVKILENCNLELTFKFNLYLPFASILLFIFRGQLLSEKKRILMLLRSIVCQYHYYHDISQNKNKKRIKIRSNSNTDKYIYSFI